MFCKNCGNKLNKEEKFCPNCGNYIDKLIEDNINIKKRISTEKVEGKRKNSKINKVLIILAMIIAIAFIIVYAVFKNKGVDSDIQGISSYFEEGLAVSSKIDEGNNYKYGYIDKNGEIVIDYKFDNAYDFREGLAPICIDQKWGYINHKGDMIINPQFDYAYQFKEGLARIYIGEKWNGSSKSTI